MFAIPKVDSSTAISTLLMAFLMGLSLNSAQAQRPPGGIKDEFRQLSQAVFTAEEEGNLELAEQLARQRLQLALQTPNNNLKKAAYLGLGSTLRQRGRFTEALTMLRKAETLFQAEGDTLSVKYVRNQMNLGGVQLALGQYQDAIQTMSKALSTLNTALPTHPDGIRVRTILAKAYQEIGRQDDAKKLLLEAIDFKAEAEAGPGKEKRSDETWINFRKAQATESLGFMAMKSRQFDEAAVRLNQALVIYRSGFGESSPDQLRCQLTLAHLQTQQGKPQIAVPQLRALAPQILEKMGDSHPMAGKVLQVLGQSLDKKKDYAEIKSLFAKAIAIYERSGSQKDLVELARPYSRLLMAHGEPLAALDVNRKAMDAIDQLHANTKGQDESTRESFAEKFAPTYTDSLEILSTLFASSKDASFVTEAFEISTRTQSRLFTEMLRESDVAALSKNENFKQLIAEFDQAKRELQQQLQYRIERVGSTKENEREADFDPLIQQRTSSWETNLRAQESKATLKVQEVQSRIASEFPRFLELSNPQPTRYKELNGLLRDKEVLVSYALLPESTLIFIATNQRLKMLRVEQGRKQVDFLIAKARATIQEPGADLQFLGHLQPSVLNELHRVLLEPVLNELKPTEHNNRFLLIGDGPLNTLPFEMLVTRWNEQDQKAFEVARQSRGAALSEYGTLKYAGDQFRFSYLPSASSLVSLRKYRKPAVAFSEDLVSFADPDFNFSGAPTEAIERAQRALNKRGQSLQIPQLPETSLEAQQIAQSLGGRSRIFTGPNAQEKQVKIANLSQTRFVHFATHGLLSGDFTAITSQLKSSVSPTKLQTDRPQPALLLTLRGDLGGEDGLLTMSEVIGQLELNAELVVLSACNTAGDDTQAQSGEGFSGLTRAFLYAGAKGLVVSHWSVESQSTAQLMTAMFKQGRSTTDWVKALAEARLSTKGGALNAGTQLISQSHPYFWAPFVYVGD